MRVLLVSYFFPPANVIAALRPGKWVKYLNHYGVEPWVLTSEPGLFATAGVLPVEIPDRQVVRASLQLEPAPLKSPGATGEAFSAPAIPGVPDSDDTSRLIGESTWRLRTRRWVWNWFARYTHVRFPDRTLPWVPPAMRAGSALLRQHTFDAVLSSHGPPSSHLIAAALSRRFRLPWVADFRDLWTQNHLIMRAGVWQRLETRIERAVLSRASSLMTVSEPLAQQLRGLHDKPVEVIPNGFDEDDFRTVPPDAEGPEGLRIVYTGGIYPGKQDPSPIFAGLVHLRATRPTLAARVQIHFVGTNEPLLENLARRFGVQDQIIFHPPCSNAEALRWQATADVLLLLEWNDPSAKGVYTGKVFEYLGARRPILATGPAGGVVDTLLRDTESGELIQDAAGAVRFIERCWDWKQSRGTTRLMDRTALLEPYTRRYQAGQVAGVLRAAVQAHIGGGQSIR